MTSNCDTDDEQLQTNRTIKPAIIRLIIFLVEFETFPWDESNVTATDEIKISLMSIYILHSWQVSI